MTDRKMEDLDRLSVDLGTIALDGQSLTPEELQVELDTVNRTMVALGLDGMVEDYEVYHEQRAAETPWETLREDVLLWQNRVDTEALNESVRREVAAHLKEYLEESEDGGDPVSAEDFALYLRIVCEMENEEPDAEPSTILTAGWHPSQAEES